MKTLLALASLSTGCLIVPATKTSTTAVGKEIETVHVGERALEITGEAQGDQIMIKASSKGTCERRVLSIHRVVKTTHARLGGSSDIRGKIFGALLAPITIPVSALITGAMVASSDTQVDRTKQIESATKGPCVEVAAGLPVRITLASGKTLERHANAAGMLAFTIPADEPTASTVIASGGAASASIEYKRPLAPVAAVREATRGCAGKLGFTGALQLKIAVGATGAPTNVGLDAGGADLASCVTSAIAKVEFAQQHRNKSLVFPFQLP